MATSLNQDDYIKTALRLPRELHARIQESAQDTERSMNAEIVARLEASFRPDPLAQTPPEQVEEMLGRALSRIAEMEDRLASMIERGGGGAERVRRIFRSTQSDDKQAPESQSEGDLQAKARVKAGQALEFVGKATNVAAPGGRIRRTKPAK